MASNYPPGVTGNEYEIAGPDYEKDSDEPCPYEPKKGTEDSIPCGESTMEQGYGGERWLVCDNEHVTDIEHDPGEDSDRKYDCGLDESCLDQDGEVKGACAHGRPRQWMPSSSE